MDGETAWEGFCGVSVPGGLWLVALRLLRDCDKSEMLLFVEKLLRMLGCGEDEVRPSTSVDERLLCLRAARVDAAGCGDALVTMVPRAEELRSGEEVGNPGRDVGATPGATPVVKAKLPDRRGPCARCAWLLW